MDLDKLPEHVTKISATELRRQIGEVIDRVIAGERIVVVRHGRPVLAVVPPSDVTIGQVPLFAAPARRAAGE